MASPEPSAGVSTPSAEGLRVDIKVPLCVDLDGTLVRTDTLVEMILFLLRLAPHRLLRLPFWMLRGKAFAKRQLGSLGTLPAATLPYQEDFLLMLRREALAGRRLILATGADISVAHEVATHLDIFSDVIASDGKTNMTGPRKASAIQQLLGATEFLYAGNSRADFPVWSTATGAILVNAPNSWAALLRTRSTVVYGIFPSPGSPWKAVFHALRVHQWLKGTLVFVPAILAHRFVPNTLFTTVIAFFAISATASAVYICNDLLDIQSDRQHPKKRKRPFASGALSIGSGLTLAALAISSAAVLSLFLPWPARVTLAFYCLAASAYSLYFKRQLFIDVVLLASFFTLRLWFGGAASGIALSIWTLAASMFLFLSLALIKRLTELRVTFRADRATLPGRGYMAEDLPVISALSGASGFLAVLVVALYLQSSEVHKLYSQPSLLWLLCPLLIFWLGRMLILANRGAIDHDPLVFAFTDKVSLIVGALAAVLFACSI